MGVEEKGQEIITSIQTTIQEVQEKVETAAVLKKYIMRLAHRQIFIQREVKRSNKKF